MRIYAALFAAVMPAAAADIVLTPPAGGAVNMTNATGSTSRLLIGEDGAISMTGNFDLGNSSATLGNLYRSGVVFLHNVGTNSMFVGLGAGNLSSTGHANSLGIGPSALSSVVAGGSNNTAVGAGALATSTTGTRNTAIGAAALNANVGGGNNTATGYQALAANTAGIANTAVGQSALVSNTSGDSNVGVGNQALMNTTTGNNNVGVGAGALNNNSTGSGNIAIGMNAGFAWTTGSSNIALGHFGVAAETSTMHLGQPGAQTRTFIAGSRGVVTGNADAIPLMIDSLHQLGTVSSSRAAKDDIADMDAASADLMKLRAVTFHYKAYGPESRLQYGLIAEEVEQVYPGLVAKRPDGSAETVMYHFLPPMLLNEVQKQQRRIADLEQQVARLTNALDRLAGGAQ